MLKDKAEGEGVPRSRGVKREMISWNRAYDVAYAALINQAIERLWDHWGEPLDTEIGRICDQAHRIANRTIEKEMHAFEFEEEQDTWL